MQYRIGLDIGIGSVGYAVLENDPVTEEPVRIVKLGVRTFNPNEVPKTGESVAKNRREKRGIRRRQRRKHFRMKRVKSLISRFLGVDFEKANQNLLNEDVYFLRAKALDEKISNEELSKVILHILKRRGFRSNRIHSTDKEEGKLKTAISENEERMNKGGYRTIGEMLYKDEAYKVECCGKLVYNVRNHGGDYRNCFSRATLANELQIILEKQKELGNEKITDEFIEKVVYIFEKQRNFDEGPGAQSPYHFDEYEVGNCTFIPTEKRAPKASYTFELFNALSKINNLKIGAEFLTQEQRKELYDVVQTKPELKFKQIRKMFSVPNDKLFNLCNYKRSKKEQDISDDEFIEKCENKVFVSMKRSYDIRKALGDVENFDADFVDAIALMCSMCKSDERVDKYIAEKNFALSADQIDKIKALSGIEKFGSLSIKAMKKIIPFLYDGERYDIACKHAGFDDASFEHEKTKYLKGKCVEEALADVTNNVVKRAVNQSLRVLNKIIEIYGSPQFVNIELARDIAKNSQDRRTIEQNQMGNTEKNQHIYDTIKSEFGVKSPSGQDILKYRLYQEQNSKCMYSGKEIEFARLFEPNYVQIDHILPISRSMNDSFSNKVLVLSKENQDKGNRTPFEYFGKDEKRWNEFKARVSLLKNVDKKRFLLKEKFTEEESAEFISRNLNDTRYMSKLLLNMMQKNLLMAPSKINEGTKSRKNIKSVSGSITSYLRKCWGINKIREDGDIHHAIDATIIACAGDSEVQKITKFNKRKELFVSRDDKFINVVTGEVMSAFEREEYENKKLDVLKDRLPQPYEWFKKELEILAKVCYTNFEFSDEEKMQLAKMNYSEEEIAQAKPVFISRMKTVKETGAIHKDTIMSTREFKETGNLIKSVSVQKLKLCNIPEEFELAGDKYPECSIENYYRPTDDRLLYLKLKNYLKEDGKIPDVVYKPRKDGSNGPIVRKVKVYEKASSYIPVSRGGAANDAMYRVDVFEKDNKYYLCPIYYADVYAHKLPNKVIAIGKPWETIDDSFKFKFSLYQNDLVRVGNNKEIVLKKKNKNENSNKPDEIENSEYMLYYNSTGISTASITLLTHDNCYIINSCGVKTLKKFEKLYVDILGNVYNAPKEERKPI